MLGKRGHSDSCSSEAEIQTSKRAKVEEKQSCCFPQFEEDLKDQSAKKRIAKLRGKQVKDAWWTPDMALGSPLQAQVA